MADSTILPGVRARLVAPDGTTTREFYRFLSALSVTASLPGRVDDLTVRVDDLDVRVDALEHGGGAVRTILGLQSVKVVGPLEDGSMQLSLAGDVISAPPLSFYGALAEYGKGWQTFSANFASLDNGDDTQSLDLADLTDTGTGALLALTFDAKGRKTGSRAATITGTAGRVTVANGDASAGPPTIDLATVADTGGGALLRFVRDAWGRITGTSAATTTDLTEGTNLYFTAARVLATVLTGLSTASSAVIAATDTVLGALGKLQAQITDNLLPAGYIDGLQMQWVSGTALTVTSGAAYVPGLGKVLRAPSAIAKTGLSLSASTWYHVYLYDNAGTPAVEVVTTAPASAYIGSARSKTGDTSRRYIGSIKTNASAGIYNFFQNGTRITYGFGIIDTTARVISAGTSTTLTTVSCSVLAPVTSRLVQVRFQNLDTVGAARLSNSGTGLSTPDALVTLSPNAPSPSFLDFPTDTSQAVQYFINGSSGGQGCYLDIIGYVYER